MRAPTVVTILSATLLLCACSKASDPPATDKKAAGAVDNDQPMPPIAPGGEVAGAAPGGGPAPTPPAAEPSAGSCEITISGDVNDTIQSRGGPQAIGTDYWMAPEDLERAVRTMVNVTASKGEDREKAFQKAMQNDPKLVVLLLNCVGDRSRLHIGPAPGSTYADVPFGAKKYAFASARKAKPGDMTAMWTYDSNMVGDVTGELNIIQWDKQKIVAELTLDGVLKDLATRAEKKLTAKGKLEFPCHGSKVCER